MSGDFPECFAEVGHDAQGIACGDCRIVAYARALPASFFVNEPQELPSSVTQTMSVVHEISRLTQAVASAAPAA